MVSVGTFHGICRYLPWCLETPSYGVWKHLHIKGKFKKNFFQIWLGSLCSQPTLQLRCYVGYFFSWIKNKLILKTTQYIFLYKKKLSIYNILNLFKKNLIQVFFWKRKLNIETTNDGHHLLFMAPSWGDGYPTWLPQLWRF